ncbi:transposase [Streptomyces sp. NPDC008137]|uniref:IS701 family transposase n=1 Tax=Streptomyces sp. NPDC008137 TaxID=3364813 RepID=UPI0036E5E1CF
MTPGTGGATSARRSSSRSSSPSPTGAFDAFIAEIFERLPRADQRGWAHVYTRGLLVTPGRKTVRRLAASVSDSATAAQGLHQFVNASPWDWEPVRARLADWVVRRSRPGALVIGTAVLPKRGDRSCGVHRRFVQRDGRTVNCQLGVGAFLALERGTVPVDWRLLLPGRWAEDAEARGRTGSAPAAGSADALALDLVDSVGPDGVPVVADLLGFADTAALAGGLAGRGRRFVVAVPDDFVVHPDRAALPGPGPRAGAGADAGGVTARSLLADHPARVATGVVRLPGIPVALRLIGEPGDGRIWLTNLADRSPREVLALARLQAGAVDTVERLADDFGLRAFEGRSYAGWHHHKTLVSAAFAYSTLGSTAPAPAPAHTTPHRPRTTRPPHRTRTSTTGGPAGTAPGRAPGVPARPFTAPGRSLPAPTRTAEPPTRTAGTRRRADGAPPWTTAGPAPALADAARAEVVAGGTVGAPERGAEVPAPSAHAAGAPARARRALGRDAEAGARTAMKRGPVAAGPLRAPEPPAQTDTASARTPEPMARAAGALTRTPRPLARDAGAGTGARTAMKRGPVAAGPLRAPEPPAQTDTASARTPEPMARAAGALTRTPRALARDAGAGAGARTAGKRGPVADGTVQAPEPPAQTDTASARTPEPMARAAGASERTPVARPRPLVAPPRTPAAPARSSTSVPRPLAASAQPPSAPARPSGPPGPIPASARRARPGAPASHSLPTPIRTES